MPKHHLYPKYLKRLDEVPPWGDPDLLVEVTHTQHIMFHWCNYQLWGNPQDRVAYLGMRGMTEESERLACELAQARIRELRKDPEFEEKYIQSRRKSGKVGLPKAREKLKILRKGEEYKRKMSEQGKINSRKAHEALAKKRKDPKYEEGYRKSRAPGAKALRERINRDPALKRHMAEVSRENGVKAGLANKGTILITNGEINRRIRPEEGIPEGWRRGMTRKNNLPELPPPPPPVVTQNHYGI